MIDLTTLMIGEEYYFFLNTHYVTGFVVWFNKNSVKINKAHMFNYDKEDPFAASAEIIINANELTSYALT